MVSLCLHSWITPHTPAHIYAHTDINTHSSKLELIKMGLIYMPEATTNLSGIIRTAVTELPRSQYMYDSKVSDGKNH